MSESGAEVCCYQQRMAPPVITGLQNSPGSHLSKARPDENSKMKTKRHQQQQQVTRPGKRLTDENNNEPVATAAQDDRLTHLRFKYQANAARADIEALRELLRRERQAQMGPKSECREPVAAEELAFYARDYERMMVDDWLVTRFLLRGKKACERAPQQQQQQQGEEENSGAGVLEHTLELIKVCAKFRFEYRINDTTQLVEFPREWTRVDGLIHHRVDRVGNPMAYLRVALHRPKLIEAPEARHQFKRYMLYLLEACDRQLHSAPGKAICCVFDMSQAGYDNMDLELTTWMIKSFKSCSPKLLCYVIVYNPPWFFTATFKVICNTLLSSSKRQSVRFACGNGILDYVSYENLPPYLQSTLQE